MTGPYQGGQGAREPMELEFCENYYCTGYLLGDDRGDDEWMAMEKGVLEADWPEMENREGKFLVGTEQINGNTRKERGNYEDKPY